MKKLIVTLMCLLASANSIAGGRSDDPLLGKVMIGQFEVRDADGSDPIVLEAQGWLGKDLHKFWAKADVERVGSETEEAELQFLYSRAVAPYWDLQVGLRHDSRPKPNRDWLAVGVQGLSPYFFEIDTAAFIGEDSRTALRLEAEYEMLFTQKLILTPEVEFNFYGKDDPELGIGSGLSNAEVGLRLRYEIRREFAPYIGINWTKLFSGTADFARDEGEKTSDTQIVAGIRAWF
jgi:copper resistance protein B